MSTIAYTYGNRDDQSPLNRVIDLQRVEVLGDYPVTLAEAKTQLRVTFTDDDAEITELIAKAVAAVENYCNISVVLQRIRCTFVGGNEWELPYRPVVSVESVQDNQSATGSGPVTYSDSDTEWSVDGNFYNPGGNYRQRITYTAGDYCPPDLKDVILQVITFLYENRGDEDTINGLLQVLSNADRYRVLLWV